MGTYQKIVPLKQGSRAVMDIRGVQGCVKKDKGVIVAPPHGPQSTNTPAPQDIQSAQTVSHIVHRKAQNIKEAMFVSANDPSLNKNLGKYQLPHIWGKILHETSALQLK